MLHAIEGQRRKKGTVEQHYCIDLRHWQRINAMKQKRFRCEWKKKNGAVVFSIEVRPHEESLSLHYERFGKEEIQLIDLGETEVGFGKRKWFLCPGCQNQKSKLYLKEGFFSCRDCHGLNYASSQAADDLEYYHWQLQKICHQLKAEYDPMAVFAPSKPLGMNWKRYSRLYLKYQKLADKRNKAFLDVLSRSGDFK